MPSAAHPVCGLACLSGMQEMFKKDVRKWKLKQAPDQNQPLQLQLRLVLAIEKLEPEIELGQDGVPEDVHAPSVGLLVGGHAGGGELERRGLGLRGCFGRAGRRWYRLLLKGKGRSAAKRQRGDQSGNGQAPSHRMSPRGKDALEECSGQACPQRS